MINVINTALSGLNAAIKRVDASASNIANISTTGALSEDNGRAPFSARDTVQSTVTDSEGNTIGVRAENVPRDPGFVPAFDPDSPFADENGLIGVPNVNLAAEAVNLQIADITYRANIAVLETADELTEDLLSTFETDA